MNVIRKLVLFIIRILALISFAASYFLMLVNCLGYEANILVRIVMGISVMVAYLLILLNIKIKKNNEVDDILEEQKESIQTNGLSGTIGLYIIFIISAILSLDDFYENINIIRANKLAIVFIIVETLALFIFKTFFAGKVVINFKNKTMLKALVGIIFWLIIITIPFVLIDKINPEDSFLSSIIFISLIGADVIYHMKKLNK
jgi:hypothetical protein